VLLPFLTFCRKDSLFVAAFRSQHNLELAGLDIKRTKAAMQEEKDQRQQKQSNLGGKYAGSRSEYDGLGDF
jgi:hypothetical protein